MAVRKRAIRKIKRLYTLATVTITIILLYWRYVLLTYAFSRRSSIVGFSSERKYDTDKISRYEAYMNTTCPVLSIRGQHDELEDSTYSKQCKPWKQTMDVCGIAQKFYSINRDIYCKTKPSNDSRKICRFTSNNIYKHKTIDKTPEINCDKQVCQNGRLFVASVNPEIGAVALTDWQEFRSAKSLELAFPVIISNNVKNGFTFCLIRCVKTYENIDQLVTFPQLLPRQRKNMRVQPPRVKLRRRKQRRNDGIVNINIVVLDSVSRNHFYRMLPKAVNTLRQTALYPDIHVLDYEFLQSVAPYTYNNIKALFTGTVEREAHSNLTQTIGINALYGHFKRLGYRTLFQEDSCWYDDWGTVLDNNIRKDKLPQSMADFKNSWENFRNLTKAYPIDDYGLTHFSCIVLMMHGITNMFNEPLKVCYDGQPVSSYFLRYTQNFFSQARKKPLFSYLHSNFGHEVTGLRIKALDDALSIFVRDMASVKDTLTIILSDHGPKTTWYSQNYLHGRYETYDSLLFMIIPKKVQDRLGASRMAALIENQKSLATMKDIHEMLIQVTQLHKRNKSSGLFSKNISERQCDSLQMVNYVVCKCEDWERIFIDQSPQFIWLAEFATEILNGKIAEQVSKLNRSGFGKCRKLQLHRVLNIRQRVLNGNYVTTFDLVVQPFYAVFLVQTKHSTFKGKVNNVQLEAWRRISIYRQYVKCKDKFVDIELCVCNLRRRYSNERLLRIIEKAKISKDNEIIETGTSCLYILLTKLQLDKLESIFSYDIINICGSRYIFTLNSLNYVENLPSNEIVKELQPNTDTFLLSVLVKGEHKPKLKYNFQEQQQ